MLITAEALKVVVTTARCRSFAAAAAELHKVPTALSYTVHKLEDILGVRLFVRNGKYLELTEAGRYFLSKGELILNELENLHYTTRRISEGVESELRFSINNILSITPLFALIKESEQLFPHTEIHLTIDVHNGVWDALINKRADLAIGAPNQKVSSDGLSCDEIGVAEWVFAISPLHPLAQYRSPLSCDDMRRYPAICIKDTSVTLDPKVAWLLHGQKSLIAPDYYSKVRMHVHGLGIGFLPRHICQPYIDEGTLIIMTVEEPKQPTPLFLAWRNQFSRPCFSWWLKQLCQPQNHKQLFSPLF